MGSSTPMVILSTKPISVEEQFLVYIRMDKKHSNADELSKLRNYTACMSEMVPSVFSCDITLGEDDSDIKAPNSVASSSVIYLS